MGNNKKIDVQPLIKSIEDFRLKLLDDLFALIDTCEDKSINIAVELQEGTYNYTITELCIENGERKFKTINDNEEEDDAAMLSMNELYTILSSL